MLLPSMHKLAAAQDQAELRAQWRNTGISAEKTAKALGCTGAYIRQWAAGNRPLSDRFFSLMLQFLSTVSPCICYFDLTEDGTPTGP